MSSRYQRRGGSAESAIIPSSGRSLIGETLKSAGLSPRKEKAEVPPFSPRKATRASMPNGIPGAATLREAYRSPNVEEGRGQERTRRSTLEPGSTSRPSSSGAGKALEVTSRTPFQFSRPSTSAGFYTRDGNNRTAPLQRGSPARGSPSKHVNGRDLMSPTPSRTPFSPALLHPRAHPRLA
ncbi:uncharacterized protein EI90DRAFT_2279950 [Cantharellus anzutake]|uniref:uncharacterized protein n=1 Tax=Cantharellus anzutake TaxID=1750568 RepID=UPI0019087D1D|nr:uncharacterized protein EI90DRAFT_2279950 [Cantharellus anzutake]KAF8339749.1 hypothetical protein EI90DRAFT_2279950 [Cantharellus anzutake]